MSIGPRFIFTRPARNASHSDRTKKLGTRKGSIKQAVQRALELSSIEKDIIAIFDGDTNHYLGSVGQVTYQRQAGPETFSRIIMEPDAMQELLADGE